LAVVRQHSLELSQAMIDLDERGLNVAFLLPV
jgi:hypothetical protein